MMMTAARPCPGRNDIEKELESLFSENRRLVGEAGDALVQLERQIAALEGLVRENMEGEDE